MLTRATNKGGDPFDMSGLSDAERAAMRQEWSLECRQAGLDHLSESFKKPSVLNPRDDAILPFVENNSMPDPIEALVSTVDATSLTPDLERKLAFLNGEGVDTVAHTGKGKFDAHLIGVASVLKAWGCDQSVVSFILILVTFVWANCLTSCLINCRLMRVCFILSTAPRASRAFVCPMNAETTSEG